LFKRGALFVVFEKFWLSVLGLLGQLSFSASLAVLWWFSVVAAEEFVC